MYDTLNQKETVLPTIKHKLITARHMIWWPKKDIIIKNGTLYINDFHGDTH